MESYSQKVIANIKQEPETSFTLILSEYLNQEIEESEVKDSISLDELTSQQTINNNIKQETEVRSTQHSKSDVIDAIPFDQITLKQIVDSIRPEPEVDFTLTLQQYLKSGGNDSISLDQFTSEEIFNNIKHEPEVHFTLTLPEDQELEIEEVKKVKELKIVLRKFDRLWKVTPGKMFESYFGCGKCDFATQSSDNLRRHLLKCKVIEKCEKCFLISKSATAEDCGLCDLKFDCSNCRRVHTSLDHHKGSKWHCTKCDYRSLTDDKESLRSHYKTHVKRFSCETCQKKFAIKFQLNLHQQQHCHGFYISKPNKQFDCNKCIRSFATRRGLEAHKKIFHSKLELHCDICGKISKCKELMRSHVKAHIKATCPICQQSIGGTRIEEHIKEHSSSKLKCDACDKVSLNKRALYQHKKTNHEINQVQCDLCCLIFQNKIHLRTHMKSHLKISCPFCKMFMTKETLKGHTKSFHFSKRNILVCKVSLCRQKFENNEKLKEHEEIHIGPKCFKCPKCKRQKKSLRDILRHIKKC